MKLVRKAFLVAFLVSATFTNDISKGNVTAMLNIEPRFLRFTGASAMTGLGGAAGAYIPPAGAYGLE